MIVGYDCRATHRSESAWVVTLMRALVSCEDSPHEVLVRADAKGERGTAAGASRRVLWGPRLSLSLSLGRELG